MDSDRHVKGYCLGMTEPVPTRKERQAETRRRLLAAATRVFTAKGFHGASVSEIAAAASCTTGALYAHFESKEALFLALIDQHLARQDDDLNDLAAAGDAEEMRQHIAARVEQLSTRLAEDGDLLGTVSGEDFTPLQAQTLSLEFLLYAVRYRPELRRSIGARYRRFDDHAAEVIQRWLDAEGGDAALAPHDLAIVQSWLIEGLALRLLMDPELVTPTRAARLYQLMVTELPLGRPRISW